jgi:hypothetical protein
VSEARLGEFVPRSLPAVGLSRSNGNEAGLRKHPLRGDILVAGHCPERPQPVLLTGNPAQTPQSGRRHAMTRDLLRNAITDRRGPIHEVGQVETAHGHPVFIDEDVKNADSGLLLGQERAKSRWWAQ